MAFCQSTCFISPVCGNDVLSLVKALRSSNLSTETALCEFQMKVVDALDSRMSAIGLFVDFSRDFDVVNHNILLAKLYRYGFRGTCFDLIQSYLQDRKQYVSVNDQKSTVSILIKGVPQGSIIGPFLFLVFANNLFSFVNRITFVINCAKIVTH